MIEHWGEEKCRKTSEKMEKQRENELEVKMAEIAKGAPASQKKTRGRFFC